MISEKDRSINRAGIRMVTNSMILMAIFAPLAIVSQLHFLIIVGLGLIAGNIVGSMIFMDVIDKSYSHIHKPRPYPIYLYGVCKECGEPLELEEMAQY
jgi:hypothetical protein